MKLHKQISISGRKRPLVSHDIHLDLFSPGRAVFTVESSEALTGLVIFECAYDSQALERWFIGYVDTSTTLDKNHQRVFCRELSAVLYQPLPMALRDVDIKSILNSVSIHTGLRFVLPQKPTMYTSQKTAAFYSISNGYFALDALPRIFNYEKPIWQQNIDGAVYVGSWDDSLWANKPVKLSSAFETNISNKESAMIPAVPKLRPGVLYNGAILTGIHFKEGDMRLTWSRNPWGERSGGEKSA